MGTAGGGCGGCEEVSVRVPMGLFINTMIRKTAAGFIKMNEEFKDFLEKK